MSEGKSVRRGRAVTAGAAVLALAAAAVAWVATAGSARQPVTGSPAGASARTTSTSAAGRSVPVAGGVAGSGTDVEFTAADLVAVSRTKVFFGHQSVGMNLLSGVPGAFAGQGVAAPVIQEESVRPGPDGGFIAHSFIGQNEQPLSKIQDFAAKLRSGAGLQIDVAMMKFCYVDITKDTDIDAIFASYRDTMAALERDFPNVTFVKMTVPLTRGGGDQSGMADNVARERLNTLIRREYVDDHLFDLAAVESTDPAGDRVLGRYEGQTYFALHPGYSSDSEGHLNAEGSQVAATAWLNVLARVSRQ